MKAIQIRSGQVEVIEKQLDESNGVKIKVASSSICGSDLHMMKMGFLEGRVPGHEFAGYAPNGKAYAIEPVTGCGDCLACDDGQINHCSSGSSVIGVMVDGGMAEYVMVPEHTLVELPSGMHLEHACLTEPLSIALHGFDRVDTEGLKHCLIIGGGPIGLAAVAAARGRGIACDILVRYDHQAAAAETLGAKAFTEADNTKHYAVVIDAIGSTESLQQAAQSCQPLGQIGMLGTAWDGTQINHSLQMKEINLINATGYKCSRPNRTFEEAAGLLHANSDIGDTMISHNYPLEAADEAFSMAANRKQGALKIAFSCP